MEKIKGFLLVVLVLFLSGCQTSVEVTERLFAMDTYMEITVHGTPEIAKKGAEELKRLEGLLKRDAVKNGKLPKETAFAIQEALDIARETEGAFDPTVAPLSDLWGFYEGEHHVPTEKELKQALSLVDYRQITIEENCLNTGNASLDLGGIGKGFASDYCCRLLKEEGVTSGILSLGGNVQTIGRKADGSMWKIGIANPQNPDEILCFVEVEEKAVVTSGGYQRYFEQAGKRYHHILNPKTGYPAESELLSVTVVGESATQCDALSTALFVMGLEKAVSYWQQENTFEMILVAKDGVYHTPGILPKESKRNLICLK
ncbi:MAG: FAD:protein FMN transferase [Ruminococcaceae bacterium]|nr:FAD:protein FMN transferase [Oscillospiraceae bacterium]